MNHPFIHKSATRFMVLVLGISLVALTGFTAVPAAGGYEQAFAQVSQPSKTIYVKPFWKAEVLRPQAPGVQSDGKNGSVIVTWVYPEADGYSAVVFRRAGRGEFTQVSPVLKSTRFADTVPGPGNYQYALKFYLAGMGGSEMGTSTSVNLK